MKTLGQKNNFLGLSKEFSDYENSEIVILPVPLEKTVTCRKGTKYGPTEILGASHFVEFYDEEMSRELCFEKGICSLPQLSFDKMGLQKSLDKIYSEIKKHLDNNKFVVTIGGEHLISLPVLKAFNEKFNELTILQIDAHSDLRDCYEGLKISHATVMARICEFNSNIVQVGIRAQCKEESDFIKQNGIRTFYSREIKMGMYGANWQEIVARSIGENVYITIDIDGFDPSVIEATGCPEPGGLMWDETMDLLKIIGTDKNIVGFDIVELAPSKANPSANYTAAKLLYKMLNYSFINK